MNIFSGKPLLLSLLLHASALGGAWLYIHNHPFEPALNKSSLDIISVEMVSGFPSHESHPLMQQHTSLPAVADQALATPRGSSRNEMPSPPEISPSNFPASLSPISLPGKAALKQDAHILYNPAPDYPEDARAKHIEGTVLIRAIISSHGNIRQATIIQSSGNTGLDENALNTLYQWRFVPARINDQAIEDVVDIPFEYKLET